MNNNYEHKYKELDKKISGVETSINKINKLELNRQKKDIKKLYKAYLSELNTLEDNVLVWDTRFKKFWTCPDILEYDSVRNVIVNFSDSERDELLPTIEAKSGSEITEKDFEDFYTNGFSQDSFHLYFYLFDKDTYESKIRSRFLGENSCGMAKPFAKNIYRDIRELSEDMGAFILYQVYFYKSYENDDNNMQRYYVYKMELGRRFHTHYSDDNNKIDFINIANNFAMYQRLLLNTSNFVVMTNEFHDKVNVTYFPETSELRDELNELKRQRRINYRQWLYNNVSSTIIKPLNTDTREKMIEEGYNISNMNKCRKFYPNNTDVINGVNQIDVLKRLESKVKLRIWIKKMFYISDDKLMTGKIKDAKAIYVPMYIDKLVDPRLYLDFLQGYKENVSEFGILDFSIHEEVNFDKIAYDNLNQSYKVDNWKWKFPIEVLDSYDTSELTLTAW
tara:strand:- start:1166 stop:2512 length:1347 start_codon:yes stop_codon:yes gene_type:complete